MLGASALVSTLVLALALLPLAPHAATVDADGERAFKGRCAKCHTARSLRSGLAKRPAQEREPYLVRFLSDHYAPDPAERAAIVAYLLRQTR